MMVVNKLKHRIATLQAIGKIQTGIVVAGRLEESHQSSRLFIGKHIRRGAEIGACRRLDTIGVAAEIDCVEIHRKYLLFREHPLEFHRHNPFLGLHDQYLDAGNLAKQACGILRASTEKVLGQLLGNGAGASSTSLHNIFYCRKQSDHIDAVMRIEALVLSIDKGSYHDRRDLFVGNRRSVLVEVTSHQHIITGIDLGCFVDHRVFNIVEARRTTKEIAEVAIDCDEEQYDKDDEGT